MRRQLRAYETNREDWLTKQRRSLVSPGLSQGLRTRARRKTYDFLTCVANTICIYICIYGHSRAYAASPYASGTALCLSYPKTGLEQKGKRTEPYKSQGSYGHYGRTFGIFLSRQTVLVVVLYLSILSPGQGWYRSANAQNSTKAPLTGNFTQVGPPILHDWAPPAPTLPHQLAPVLEQARAQLHARPVPAVPVARARQQRILLLGENG